MTSPSSASASRRRQRSTRVTVAASLIAASAVLVLASVASGNNVLVVFSALVSVALGAGAVKITHSELLQTRRDAAADRAAQARSYRDLTARRTAENVAFAETMKARIAERQEVISQLETELGKALERAAASTLKMNSEARRADLAEAARTEMVAQLDDADQRAAEAIVRVAELEVELDALRAELVTWQAAAQQDNRKRA